VTNIGFYIKQTSFLTTDDNPEHIAPFPKYDTSALSGFLNTTQHIPFCSTTTIDGVIWYVGSINPMSARFADAAFAKQIQGLSPLFLAEIYSLPSKSAPTIYSDKACFLEGCKDWESRRQFLADKMCGRRLAAYDEAYTYKKVGPYHLACAEDGGIHVPTAMLLITFITAIIIILFCCIMTTLGCYRCCFTKTVYTAGGAIYRHPIHQHLSAVTDV